MGGLYICSGIGYNIYGSNKSGRIVAANFAGSLALVKMAANGCKPLLPEFYAIVLLWVSLTPICQESYYSNPK